jgi:hypothetical protein
MGDHQSFRLEYLLKTVSERRSTPRRRRAGNVPVTWSPWYVRTIRPCHRKHYDTFRFQFRCRGVSGIVCFDQKIQKQYGLVWMKYSLIQTFFWIFENPAGNSLYWIITGCKMRAGGWIGSAISPMSSAASDMSSVQSRHLSGGSDVSGRDGNVPLCRWALPRSSCSSYQWHEQIYQTRCYRGCTSYDDIQSALQWPNGWRSAVW